MQVTDKVFVVTGAGDGMGREVVLALLSRGGEVAAVDLVRDRLDETARLAGTASDRLSAHVVDLTDRAAVEALPDAVREAHGRIDGLVNVAATSGAPGRFADVGYAELEDVLEVNLWGVVHTCRTFLPHLVVRREACIVNVSSTAALVPVAGRAMYGASMAAVKLLTEGLHAELRATTVAVTVVLPDPADTGAPGPPVGPDAAVEGAHAEPVAGGTTAADAARQVVVAIEQGSPRVVIGKEARRLDRLSRFFPHRATERAARNPAPLPTP